jgi:hypothetical protein
VLDARQHNAAAGEGVDDFYETINGSGRTGAKRLLSLP